MAAFDFASWVAKAQAFARHLGARHDVTIEANAGEPPATSSELARVERLLGSPLPGALRAFYETGARGLDCRYCYEPDPADETFSALFPDQSSLYGGARIDRLEELPEAARSVREWASDTWIGADPRERMLWEVGVPFLRLDNGDFLALDRRGENSDPSVLYLSHDGESFELAPRFTEFLSVWADLCYVGPEAWLLDPFRGRNGVLESTGVRVRDLQKLLADPRAPAV